MSHYDVIDYNGLVEVAAIGEYDYSWNELKVFYQPTSNRFFWQSDSGCSCYGYGEDLNELGDFEDGDKAAAIRAIEAYFAGLEGAHYATTTEEYAAAKASIRNFGVGKKP